MRCIQISLCILFSKKQTDYDAYEVVYASYFKRILLTTMHRPFSMRLKSLKSPKTRCIRRPRPHKQRVASNETTPKLVKICFCRRTLLIPSCFPHKRSAEDLQRGMIMFGLIHRLLRHSRSFLLRNISNNCLCCEEC